MMIRMRTSSPPPIYMTFFSFVSARTGQPFLVLAGAGCTSPRDSPLRSCLEDEDEQDDDKDQNEQSSTDIHPFASFVAVRACLT